MSIPSAQGPSYYSSKELGASLKQVASDVIKSGEHLIESLWFHSDMDVDLYVWLDDRQNVIKQQLTVFGQVVEWNVLDGIRTGYLKDEENGIGINDPGRLCFDFQPLASSVDQATSLVENMGQVPQILRDKIAENFLMSPDIDNLSSVEFLRRYGQDPRQSESKGPWAQMIKKLTHLFR